MWRGVLVGRTHCESLVEPAAPHLVEELLASDAFLLPDPDRALRSLVSVSVGSVVSGSSIAVSVTVAAGSDATVVSVTVGTGVPGSAGVPSGEQAARPTAKPARVATAAAVRLAFMMDPPRLIHLGLNYHAREGVTPVDMDSKIAEPAAGTQSQGR